MFPRQYGDEETGNDQNWSRTYDPELGQYLQSDTIGLAGGLNRYAYVGGDPVRRVDPTGDFAFLIPAIPYIAGVLTGVAIDLYIQTQIEGKSLRCVNLTSVGVSAAGGLIPSVSFVKPFRALKSGIRQEKRISRVFGKAFTSKKKWDAITDFGVTIDTLLASAAIGLHVPKYLPEYTVGSDCECGRSSKNNSNGSTKSQHPNSNGLRGRYSFN